MKQLLHPWSLLTPPRAHHHALFPPSLPFTFPTPKKTHTHFLLSSSKASSKDLTPTTPPFDDEEEDEDEEKREEGEGEGDELSGRERRRMRNARRESNLGYNWREEVEDRLLIKPKKKYVPKSAELNLDNLEAFGPRWWILRVSKLKGHETAERVARVLARNYPHMDFKVYAPTIQVKKKLKDGTISVKPKPFIPGSAFLWCVLNKEMHDFIKEIYGVNGFIGTKVVYTKRRQILKPKPIPDREMEKIFRESKEEQVAVDQAFEEEQKVKATPVMKKLEADGATKSATKSKPRTTSSEVSDSPENGSPRKREKIVLPLGTTIQVLSGKFAGFKGTVKKLDRKSRKATVSITLFGKESMVDLDLEEIVAETK